MEYSYIQKIVDSHPVLLFMKGSPDHPACGFSRTISTILTLHKAPFHSVDILEDPQLREDLKVFSRWPTFPQLYINGELIGGCDIVDELHESNKLQDLLKVVCPKTSTPEG